MEIHLKPDLQAKLEKLATETGLPAGDLVENALSSFFDELAVTRKMLDRRYDDVKSGRVRLIDGDEAFARLMAKREVSGTQPE